MNLPATELSAHGRPQQSWVKPGDWTLTVNPGRRAGERREAARDRLTERRRRALSHRAVRGLNVIVAIVGLIITAPLFLAVAVLVKLSSPGPVFYVQDRVGLDRRRRGPTVSPSMGRRRVDRGGRLFRIYKFRTMVSDSDRAGQVWASRDDPRITGIGHVLRKYRLDELPQLFNVLKGDMNIVGPRPEQPEIFQELREKVTRYQDRQKVLPGITGWAQVNHAYDQSIEDVRTKVELDLEYIEQRSLSRDLAIMARTVPVMIGKKGSI